MSDSVHLRNARALDARNKQMTGEMDALRERVKNLEAQSAMQAQAVRDVQQMLTAILVSRGHGPTGR